MDDVTQRSASENELQPGVADETWRAEANPDLNYDGGSGGTQDPPPDPDQDQPGDPPPRADLDFDGSSGGTQDPPPDPDQDQPGDPPPPEVADNNGR